MKCSAELSFTIIDNFVLTQNYIIKKMIIGKNGRIKKLQKLRVPLWLVKNIRKVIFLFTFDYDAPLSVNLYPLAR